MASGRLLYACSPKSSSNMFINDFGAIISLMFSTSLTVILLVGTLFVRGSVVKWSGPLTVQPCLSHTAKRPSPLFTTTQSGSRAFGQLFPIKGPISNSGFKAAISETIFFGCSIQLTILGVGICSWSAGISFLV